MKDEFDRLDTRRQPGPLVDALGGRVEQYYALDELEITHIFRREINSLDKTLDSTSNI
jgi:hypothetical protein